jgi:hypothetical protein
MDLAEQVREFYEMAAQYYNTSLLFYDNKESV